MPIVPAKVVTIIAVFEAQEKIENHLKALGLKGWSFDRCKGRGIRGTRLGGFSDGDNLNFTVIASEEVAEKLITWVGESLNPLDPAVAYAVDAVTFRRPPKAP